MLLLVEKEWQISWDIIWEMKTAKESSKQYGALKGRGSILRANNTEVQRVLNKKICRAAVRILKSNIKEKSCASEHIQCLTLPDYWIRKTDSFRVSKANCTATFDYTNHRSFCGKIHWCWLITFAAKYSSSNRFSEKKNYLVLLYLYVLHSLCQFWTPLNLVLTQRTAVTIILNLVFR